jgi:hypothetical protein
VNRSAAAAGPSTATPDGSASTCWITFVGLDLAAQAAAAEDVAERLLPGVADDVGGQLQRQRAARERRQDRLDDRIVRRVHDAGEPGDQELARARGVEVRERDVDGLHAGQLGAAGGDHPEAGHGPLQLAEEVPELVDVVLAAVLHRLQRVDREDEDAAARQLRTQDPAELVDVAAALRVRDDGEPVAPARAALDRDARMQRLGGRGLHRAQRLGELGQLDRDLPDDLRQERERLVRVEPRPVEVDVREDEALRAVREEELRQHRRLAGSSRRVDQERRPAPVAQREQELADAPPEAPGDPGNALALDQRGPGEDVVLQPREDVGAAVEPLPGQRAQRREQLRARQLLLDGGDRGGARQRVAEPLAQLQDLRQLVEAQPLQRHAAARDRLERDLHRVVGIDVVAEHAVQPAGRREPPQGRRADLVRQHPRRAPVGRLDELGVVEHVRARVRRGRHGRHEHVRVGERPAHRRGLPQRPALLARGWRLGDAHGSATCGPKWV